MHWETDSQITDQQACESPEQMVHTDAWIMEKVAVAGLVGEAKRCSGKKATGKSNWKSITFCWEKYQEKKVLVIVLGLMKTVTTFT